MNREQTGFRLLEQTDFQALEQAASLKGVLTPFKGKGALEQCSRRHAELRDGLVQLAQRIILPQAQAFPFALLPAHLGLQTTGAGSAFLRWRNADRSAMGVALWERMIHSPKTPSRLLEELLLMEYQRITLNMQVSLLHSIFRQSQACAAKMAQAERHYLERVSQPTKPLR